ncbi:NAD(P)-dependent oxidoreductase [Nitrospira sp. NS4]|uniref:NAD(P)-dependent oxidoreductase n=1 Tax=Nitrospira sp. NS4 TaxID=3414498 RepID=UPI003C2E14BC
MFRHRLRVSGQPDLPDPHPAARTPLSSHGHTTMHIAVIGMGLLGRAVAERLHDQGHAVTVYNRTAAKTEPLRARGLAVAPSPSDALAAADCALLFLTDAAAIRSVLFEATPPEALRNRTIIQMGTISPEESQALLASVTKAGGDYCEAPVLGSIAEALAGSLLVMAGGTQDQFDHWNPVFRSLSSAPTLIGTVGQAATLKLALNHLIAAELTAFASSLGLIQRSGVSVDHFMAILKTSALFAPAFEKKLPRLLTRQYDNPNFPTTHLLKDVNLFAGEARHRGLPVTSVESLRSILEDTIARGYGEADYSALFETMNPKD